MDTTYPMHTDGLWLYVYVGMKRVVLILFLGNWREIALLGIYNDSCVIAYQLLFLCI